MKRVLILATVAYMIEEFNMPNIKLLQSMGYHVDVACNFINGNVLPKGKIEELKQQLNEMGVNYYQIDFERNVTRVIRNVRAMFQVRALLKKNHYDFLHCHTPMGGVAGRMMGKITGTKVIYTAHGFHFYKGAPMLNWLIYYPIEKFLSRWTDILITINREDYQCAKRHFHMKRLEYIPGVGVDIEKFSMNMPNQQNKRIELGIPDNMIWVLSVGELHKRKNHEALIKAVAHIDNVYLTIAGQGQLERYLADLINKLGINHRVKLLGYRTDIPELCYGADVFALPSLQEGLSVALMEAMAAGKAVICSKIRGNTDLIDDGKGGFLFDPNNVNDIIGALCKIEKADRKSMGFYNEQRIKSFDLLNVIGKERDIYTELAGGGALRNVIDQQLLRQEFNLNINNKVVTYIAELNKNKNQISLFYMLKELYNKRNDIVLLLVGTGDDEQLLRKKASELGIKEHIVFAGFRNDIPRILNLTDVYVASSIREGLGMNVIEAMASGVPIVAYDNRGHRSIIEDGANGFLVKNGDYKMMALKVNQLLNNSDIYQHFSIKEKEQAQKYGIAMVTRKMENIYREIN